LSFRLVTHTVGPFAALPRRLLINLRSEIAQKRIMNNFFVEAGSLRPPFLAIFDEEFALCDARRAKGIRLDDVRPSL